MLALHGQITPRQLLKVFTMKPKNGTAVLSAGRLHGQAVCGNGCRIFRHALYNAMFPVFMKQKNRHPRSSRKYGHHFHPLLFFSKFRKTTGLRISAGKQPGKAPMNILFVNSARTWGGTEKWTHMAAEALAESHHTALAYRRDLVGERFSVPKFRLPFSSHIDLCTLFRLVAIMRAERIDVVIPTKRKDYLIAGLAGRICRTTTILRLGIERRLTIPLLHRLIYRTLPHGLIVNAEKIRTTLLQSPFMKAQRIRVIHNGVDTASIDRQKGGDIPKNTCFTVTAAGILTARKGFGFLIGGFARFLSLAPDIRAELVIIGDGPKKKELQENCAALGIAGRVRFTGFLDNPYPLMAASHVTAMTSINEGISNALLEGMYLMNVPVSTPAGGTGELIDNGRNGFLVDYGDLDSLASVLHELYRHPDKRCTLAGHARSTVLESFSLTVMRDAIAAFCAEPVRSGKSAEERKQP
jgi:glycosyltransferase involved in cell wall biosynthesis